MADRVLLELPGMEYACSFPSLEDLLRYSIPTFLHIVSDPKADLTVFFYRFAPVLKAYEDPPLEATWFFSALKFRDLSHVPDNFISILSRLSAFAASSPAAAKPLALLAPVVSGLFHSDKPPREIEALVETVLMYIIKICGSRPAGGKVNARDSSRVLPVFPDLVKAWIPLAMRDRDPFQVLFPLAGDEARRELEKEGCSVTFLAGVVVAEAFLLRLYLKVEGGATGVTRSELRKQVLTWAISCFEAITNQQFYGVLLNMLVNDGALPSYSSLSAGGAKLARDVLYGALILSDYSVLDRAEVDRAEVDRADSSLFPIFLSRLVITFDAITDARHNEDREREEFYINAFLTSNICSYFNSSAIFQAGTKQLGKPVASTPEAFLKWLVDLDRKDLIVLGESRSGIKERLMHDEGLDKKGSKDEEAVEMETADNVLIPSAHITKVMENDTRKRKDSRTEDAKVAKFVKCKAEDVPVKDYLQATSGMSSGRGVENLQSDDEMEETV